MCRRVQCNKCGKPTWSGCGAHIEQVLGDVPAAQRCSCRSGGAKAPAAQTQAAGADGKTGSLLGRLLGR